MSAEESLTCLHRPCRNCWFCSFLVWTLKDFNQFFSSVPKFRTLSKGNWVHYTLLWQIWLLDAQLSHLPAAHNDKIWCVSFPGFLWEDIPTWAQREPGWASLDDQGTRTTRAAV